MSKRNIVLIGAGSAMFTRGLVADLITSGREWDLRLVDIDPENLDVAHRLSEKMVELKDAPIEVKASTERKDLLPGADVVVTTVAVGGRRAWETDVFIPRKYGVFQPVGDTIMPGGIFRALRMIPTMIEIARDVVELCPRALFFNYSNPMTTICRAIHKTTSAKVVGLCHGVHHVERYLADFIGVPHKETQSSAVGVNHLTWFTEFRWRGKDAWPLVRRRMAEQMGTKIDVGELGSEFSEMGKPRLDAPKVSDNPFSWELFGIYGAFPAVLDRHVSEFFPQMHFEKAYYGKTLGVDAFSFEKVIEHGDRIFSSMTEQAHGRSPLDESVFERREGEHEQLLDILNSLWGDENEIYSVNLPNSGQVSNLPGGAILESPAVVNASGVHPISLGEVPPGIEAILQRVIGVQELTVEAALTGDRNILVQALIADGNVSSPGEAGKMADEMLRAHAEYLPQFR
ncbi:MAG: family 4 glycosyl hydrolase [bacterium]